MTASEGINGCPVAVSLNVACDDITVNLVDACLIRTPRPKYKPEPAHHLTLQTITGERGKPEDVAAAVRFLCGEGARYITGQAIHANGGARFGAPGTVSMPVCPSIVWQKLCGAAAFSTCASRVDETTQHKNVRS